ncbi:response regulator transcription factor [Allokutzneria sp. NRRL B-24872]|uniref:response regulator transcription factor n=1 Tax=Allokutzneria sp. NRRL B-24872 TaxID=1137961 RepID=UPI000A39CA97|nr:response regulator transcription factor [Allokutzneria sp. NRRL B-24872]
MSLHTPPPDLRPRDHACTCSREETQDTRLRVLAVDRHPVVAEGLRACFTRHPDFTFVGAVGGGARVVDQVCAARPDVVLVDIDLGEVDGIEVIKAVLRTRLPVVVVVFSDNQARAGAALEAGAMGFVLKTAAPEELISAVRQARSGVAAMPSQLLPVPGRMPRLRRQESRSVLSGRELDVLRLVAEGLTNAEIGRRLFVAETTVKTHLQRVFSKLHVSDRAAAVANALSNGLLIPGPEGFGGGLRVLDAEPVMTGARRSAS